MRKVVHEDIILADIESLPDKELFIRSNPEHAAKIDEYARIFDVLPPIRVHRVSGRVLLADGYHRCAAARKIGRTTIRAIIIDITNEPMSEYNLFASTPWSKQ
jgi:ParB-like chromosome segregation protein Spo0J